MRGASVRDDNGVGCWEVQNAARPRRTTPESHASRVPEWINAVKGETASGREAALDRVYPLWPDPGMVFRVGFGWGRKKMSGESGLPLLKAGQERCRCERDVTIQRRS